MKYLKPYVIFLVTIIFVLVVSCSKDDSVINTKPEDEEIPIPSQKEPAKQELNIAYGNHPLQKMDVYFPAGYSASTPVVFLAHGGGFYEGAKEGFTSQAKMMMNEGFIVVNFNYRLIDSTGLFNKPPLHQKSEIRVGHAVEDADAVVEKYKSLATAWGAGTSKMYMAGHSAGAILSMLYVQGGKNKDKEVRASGNWAGTTNLALPKDGIKLSNPDAENFYRELYFRWTGAEPIQANALYYMAISPDWVTIANGGMPNVSIMPEKNDDFIIFTITGSMATISSVNNYHKDLTRKNIPNENIMIAGENHGFSVKPNSWYRTIKYTAEFFKKN